MPDTPHHYHGQTTSLCEKCLKLVPAKIVEEAEYIYYEKYCAEHGELKTLISTDAEYWKQSRAVGVISHRPHSAKHQIVLGCPFDCGLCTDHEQRTAMGVVEILDECNLRCPTCIAASHPGAGKLKSLDVIEKMLDVLVESEGVLGLAMISGGEPTIHPKIFEVLALAKTKAIRHLMLITNGVRIAKDLAFVEELKKYRENFEVYLQFDSLSPAVLTNLRGEDLSEVRRKALDNLEAAGIHSTLVCVVKKGVNEREMAEVIEIGLGYKYVRGVTFQPCKVTGRNEYFEKDKHYITLSEVRTGILNNSTRFDAWDLIPHPLNPENICIGYLMQKNDEIVPITRFLFRDSTPSKRWKVEFPYSDRLKERMFFTPDLDCAEVTYDQLFRVSIVSFLDKYNFCIASVKQSCIHFVTKGGEIVPIDTYYMLYASAPEGA